MRKHCIIFALSVVAGFLSFSCVLAQIDPELKSYEWPEIGGRGDVKKADTIAAMQALPGLEDGDQITTAGAATNNDGKGRLYRYFATPQTDEFFAAAVNTVANTLAPINHPDTWTVGQKVVLNWSTQPTSDPQVRTDRLYYVNGVPTAGQYTLSETSPGGATINFSTAGSGVQIGSAEDGLDVLATTDDQGGFLSTQSGSLTTKGDLHGYSDKRRRLPIGADNAILTADSNAHLGLAWHPPQSRWFDNVANAVAATDLVNGQIIATGAYVNPSAGGANRYVFDAESTATPDGGFIIAVTSGGRLIAIDQTAANVKQFGAIGDGVANDLPAFNASYQAIAARGGGDVIVPDGNYLFSDLDATTRFELDKSNVTVRCSRGAVITGRMSATAPSYHMVRFNGDGGNNGYNNHIIGGKWIGDETNNGNIGQEQGHVIYAGQYVHNCSVRDVEVQDAWGDGILIGNAGVDACTEFTITRARIRSVMRNGISVTAGEHITITDCDIRDVLQDPGGGATSGPWVAIDVEPNNGQEYIRDVTIRNITARNCTGGGITVIAPHVGDDVQRINISDIDAPMKNGIRVYGAQGVNFSDCKVETTENQHAINCSWRNCRAEWFYLAGCQRCEVTDCVTRGGVQSRIGFEVRWAENTGVKYPGEYIAEDVTLQGCDSYDQNGRGFLVQRASRIKLANCRSLRANGVALFMQNVKDSDVSNCFFANGNATFDSGPAIQIQNVSFTRFSDNVIRRSPTVVRAQAAGGTATTIDLAPNVSQPINGRYNGYTIELTEGVGAGQTKTITDYTWNPNYRATVDTAWTTSPDGTSKYFMYSGLSFTYGVYDVQGASVNNIFNNNDCRDSSRFACFQNLHTSNIFTGNIEGPLDAGTRKADTP